MKSLSGIILIAIKLYCVFKILQWFYFQHIDKVNHPLSEIEYILVFFVFDIWIMLSANQIKDDVDDFRV
jgi:hypothetical protein